MIALFKKYLHFNFFYWLYASCNLKAYTFSYSCYSDSKSICYIVLYDDFDKMSSNFNVQDWIYFKVRTRAETSLYFLLINIEPLFDGSINEYEHFWYSFCAGLRYTSDYSCLYGITLQDVALVYCFT